jgi:hypothetical protein
MGKLMLGSLTRIADLPEWPFPYERIDRSEWAAGDYMVGEVIPHDFQDQGFELATGRAIHPMAGDLLIGAFARRIAATGASVAVIEAGASPLELYNGRTLVDMIDEHIVFTILATSDPYAVVGIQQGWQRTFDLVTGPTANTKAGVQLVHELAGLPALDIMDHATHGSVRQRLQDAVGSKGHA